MKRILLLRHAKSSHAEAGVRDFDRPLNDRGLAAAAAMGRSMAGAGRIPDDILCSAARRARETLDALWQDWPQRPRADWDEALYGAAAQGLRQRLTILPEAVESVLVIGHNPAIEELARDLAGGGDPDAYATMRAKYPTAALAVLDADIGAWAELRTAAADLTAFVRPRDLAEAE